jgi:2'-5' RNA ligase
MGISGDEAEAERRCRERYIRIARECRRRGLAIEEITRSRDDLNERRDGRIWLKPEAYYPTGVALGFPLPDRRFERRLERILSLLQRRLGGDIALVPPGAYHVTLVNRGHFDVGPVVSLTGIELDAAAGIVSSLALPPLDLHFHGLALTRTGRFIVPGYPCRSDVFRLRRALYEAVPSLRVNTPRTTHIKIGHLLRPLSGEELGRTREWMAAAGELISARIVFEDVFTPLGRIPLGV